MLLHPTLLNPTRPTQPTQPHPTQPNPIQSNRSIKPSGSSMSSETEADTPTDLRRVSRGDWDWV